MNKTPLFDKHVALGATMGDFGGWNMPLWYKTGQKAEHIATRDNCGLFDICHMGEFYIRGDAKACGLEEIFSFSISDMAAGKCRYGAILNEKGGIKDDLIVYRIAKEEWMVVVNSATVDKDAEHI